MEAGVKLKFLRVSEVNNIDNVAYLQRYIHYQHLSKRRKRKLKKFRFSPDFTHFSLKHNGYKKKTSLSNSRKIACWFFSKVHNFLKMWWKSNIFSRGHSTSLELLWNKKSWWSYLTSAPQIQKTKKNLSLSTVQMTLKTLLLGYNIMTLLHWYFVPWP